jgi:transposase
MWEQDASAKEIASALGISAESVRAIAASLRARGLKLKLRQISKHDHELIARMWNSGMTAAEIALAVGSTLASISKVVSNLRGRGWGLERRRRPRRKLDRERVMELWNSGMTAAEIAPVVGATPKAIESRVYRLRKQGWDLKRRR